MKSLLFIFILGLFLNQPELDTEAKNPEQNIPFNINFVHSWKEAKKKAKAEGKPIFVDAYTTWCGPCKYMSAKVFTQKEVASFYNKNFINVKLDMEKGEGLLFARSHRVSAYPSLLYFNSSGDLIKKEVGAKRGPEFLDLGKKMLAQAK